jgi:hypothetical protein
MKKAKAARVPILENAFELNLPKLMRAVKTTGDCRVVLDDGVVRTVAVLAETRLAVLLGDRQWVVDIVPVQCLKDRVRPCLRCPRAHEGNFQSLYFRSGVLACRQCHQLRYRSTVSGNKMDAARLARRKLLDRMGGEHKCDVPNRFPGKWRKKYVDQLRKLESLTTVHFDYLKKFVK